jgi:hypothetical protein
MTDLTVLAMFFLQGGIFGLFLVSVRRQNVAAAVNALGSLALALLPVVVELVLEVLFVQSISFGPVLPIWLAVAGFLHSLGMLGLYESTWWWDHLTHTVSAGLVAALLYAALIVALPDIVEVGNSSDVVSAVTLVFTFAIGVFWELIELVAREIGEWFDIKPVLVHYGWGDTAADLVFDVVGALLIVGTDLRVFVPVAEQFPELTETALIGTGWVVILGSLLMAIFVGLGTTRQGN